MIKPPSTLTRVLSAFSEGRALTTLNHRVRPHLNGAANLLRPSGLTIEVPSEVDGSSNAALAERVLNAYQRAKRHQREADPVFNPSEAWQALLDRGFASLAQLSTAPHFIANFGIWQDPLGFDGNETMRAAASSPFLRAYLKHSVFGYGLDFWKRYYGGRRSIDALNSPRFGNQPGALTSDGVFLDVNSFHNEIRGDMLAGLVRGMDRPVLADLGGGSGKTAEFMLRQLGSAARWTYIDFDLPESLAIASYYLLSCYPDKKTLLYGEGELNEAALRNYDLILWPSFRLPHVPLNGAVDLFINRVSLGEMAKSTAFAYVREINRITGRYFFHMNHDGARSPHVYKDGTERGPLAHEYPVAPDFRLLYRYPDLGHMLRQGELDQSADVVMHLYARA